jgi:hypothetical protein
MTVIDLKTKRKKEIETSNKKQYKTFKGFIGTIQTNEHGIVYFIKRIFK